MRHKMAIVKILSIRIRGSYIKLYTIPLIRTSLLVLAWRTSGITSELMHHDVYTLWHISFEHHRAHVDCYIWEVLRRATRRTKNLRSTAQLRGEVAVASETLRLSIMGIN